MTFNTTKVKTLWLTLCASLALATTPTTAQVYSAPKESSVYDTNNKQLKCLADSVYYEAGNQSYQGKVAVASIVMNRVRDRRFPSTPCGVIYQKNGRMCQFSWTCGGKRKIDRNQYADALKVAEQVLYSRVGDNTSGALFFHAKYVNPKWKYQRVKVIGSHIFYKG